MMNISDNGINFIKQHEAFKPKFYRDVAGVGTIGYGHTKTAKPGMVINQDQANALLQDDLQRFQDRVNKYVTVPLNQNQFDALVSFDYNTGGLAKSTLLKQLNAGNYQAVGHELQKWYYSGGKPVQGLRNRRQAEQDLFYKPPEQQENQQQETPTSPMLNNMLGQGY